MDGRLRKFKIDLPKYWKDVSNDNPNGPPTFINNLLEEPGVLQISIAEYIKGTIPNPNHEDLLNLSEKNGLNNEFGEIINKESGQCVFGIYGKVEFNNKDFPHISIWHLSDGKDFIFSTFICSKIPDESEIRDVAEILKSIKRRKFSIF